MATASPQFVVVNALVKTLKFNKILSYTNDKRTSEKAKQSLRFYPSSPLSHSQARQTTVHYHSSGHSSRTSCRKDKTCSLVEVLWNTLAGFTWTTAPTLRSNTRITVDGNWKTQFLCRTTVIFICWCSH